MQVTLNIINAFTHNQQGGNPAAVVLNADQYTLQQKQAIALNAGLSETAFVSKSATAEFKLDFFTPVRQIAHCGHATIATFTYLNQLGLLQSADKSSKETIEGVREIRLMEGLVFMQQQPPRVTWPDNLQKADILQSLGLGGLDLNPVFVNTGNTFMLLEVESPVMLQELQPQFDAISRISEQHGLIGYYVFITNSAPGVDASSRMFAPAYGIEEESATGMAAGPLACWLHRSGLRKNVYHIEQGRYMDQPSVSMIQVRLEAAGDDVLTVFAGGEATLLDQRTILLNDIGAL